VTLDVLGQTFGTYPEEEAAALLRALCRVIEKRRELIPVG